MNTNERVNHTYKTVRFSNTSKQVSKQANDLYVAPKSTYESRAHYSPEPVQGNS